MGACSPWLLRDGDLSLDHEEQVTDVLNLPVIFMILTAINASVRNRPANAWPKRSHHATTICTKQLFIDDCLKFTILNHHFPTPSKRLSGASGVLPLRPLWSIPTGWPCSIPETDPSGSVVRTQPRHRCRFHSGAFLNKAAHEKAPLWKRGTLLAADRNSLSYVLLSLTTAR